MNCRHRLLLNSRVHAPMLGFCLLLLIPSVVAQPPSVTRGSLDSSGSKIDPKELPVRRVGSLGPAAESYFSPDSKSLICNAKLEGDSAYQVYTVRLDGTGIRRINNKGEDACSFFFPSGKRLVWTSTRDWPDLPKGNYSEAENYPQGAEIYSSDLKGGKVKRLTNNRSYDAEVTVSPNGKWLVFARQIEGRIDLWRMRPDGSGQQQITHTPDWQEGGVQYLPDSETLIFRAWKIQDQGQRGMPMTIFTLRHDGTGLQQITDEPGTHWAPFPHPDGKHFAFVKFLPPRNFEIYLMNRITKEQKRLTYFDGFDGFPSFSPDGRWLSFSSSRETPQGDRSLRLFLMDVSSLMR